jgi:LysM repeat protein
MDNLRATAPTTGSGTPTTGTGPPDEPADGNSSAPTATPTAPGEPVTVRAAWSAPAPSGRRRMAIRIAKGVGVPLVAAGLITAGSPGIGQYKVKSGDTLSHIALRHGTTVSALVKLNHLPGNGNIIYAGEVLKIPGKGGASRSVQPRGGVMYMVKPGDTIEGIARRYKIKQRALLAANGLGRSNRIFAGRPLRIPVAVKPQPKKTKNNTFAGRTYPDPVVAAADRNRAILRKKKLPTRSQIRAAIIATAQRHGVDPELALAISWQESGWKQRVVSPANAIGAMQVIPSTGQFASDVIGRDLDLLKPRDNITAGVVLLDRLTGSASLPIAVAAYYPGLGGVRKNGMYADTKVYVENVLRIKQRLERGWNPAR